MFVFLHGETEWNRAGRFQGRADSPLTDRGYAQAEAVGDILKCRRPPAGFRLISSPLSRAQKTAKIVASRLGIPRIDLDDRLAEIDVGLCEGLTRAEGSARFPAELGAVHRYEWPLQAPGGEGFPSLAARLDAWLADHRDHEDLLVCTHGIASRILRGLYAGMSREEMIGGEIARGIVFRLSGGAIERVPAAPHIVPEAPPV